MIPIYAPSRVLLDQKGRAIAIEPLQVVTVPVPSLSDWNGRVFRHVYRRRA